MLIISISSIISMLNLKRAIKKDNDDKIKSVENLMMTIKSKLNKEKKNHRANEENWDYICKDISDLRVFINELTLKEIEMYSESIQKDILPIMNEIIDEKPVEYYLKENHDFKIKLMALSHYMLNYGAYGDNYPSGSNKIYNFVFFGNSPTGINNVIKKVMCEGKVDLDNEFPFYYKDKYLELHDKRRYDWEEYFYRENH